MPESPTIHIRSARPDDWPFIDRLIPRLHEFGPPPWRDVREMDEGVRRVLKQVVAAVPAESAVLIAEDASGRPVGFIHLETEVDYFTEASHGHVSDIAVSREGEGSGVGRALMAEADTWARGRGYPFLTLNVFTHNERARRLYRRLGYGEDVVRCVKDLR